MWSVFTLLFVVSGVLAVPLVGIDSNYTTHNTSLSKPIIRSPESNFSVHSDYDVWSIALEATRADLSNQTADINATGGSPPCSGNNGTVPHEYCKCQVPYDAGEKFPFGGAVNNSSYPSLAELENIFEIDVPSRTSNSTKTGSVNGTATNETKSRGPVNMTREDPRIHGINNTVAGMEELTYADEAVVSSLVDIPGNISGNSKHSNGTGGNSRSSGSIWTPSHNGTVLHTIRLPSNFTGGNRLPVRRNDTTAGFNDDNANSTYIQRGADKDRGIGDIGNYTRVPYVAKDYGDLNTSSGNQGIDFLSADNNTILTWNGSIPLSNGDSAASVRVDREVAPNSTDCPELVVRSEWGGKPPVLVEHLKKPAQFVLIHHTYIPGACNQSSDCEEKMRQMQQFHMGKGWNDIAYNFLIGGDNKVYAGRGWGVVGAHSPKYNFISVGICFIGDYRNSEPTASMLDLARSLIACGVAQGSIVEDYRLIGHRQVRDTECPGDALFSEIQHWPHWVQYTDIVPRENKTAKP